MTPCPEIHPSRYIHSADIDAMQFGKSDTSDGLKLTVWTKEGKKIVFMSGVARDDIELFMREISMRHMSHREKADMFGTHLHNSAEVIRESHQNRMSEPSQQGVDLWNTLHHAEAIQFLSEAFQKKIFKGPPDVIA